MRSTLFFHGLVHPLGLPFLTHFALSVPPSIIALVGAIATRIAWFVFDVVCAPALCLLNALAVHGPLRWVDRLSDSFFEPRLRLGPCLAVPTGSVSLLTLGIESATSVVLDTIILVALLEPAIISVSVVAAHTSSKALGALLAKAFARLNSTPPLAVSIRVTTGSKTSTPTTTGFSVAANSTHFASLEAVAEFGIARGFVIAVGISEGGSGGAGEVCTRRPKDDAIRT